MSGEQDCMQYINLAKTYQELENTSKRLEKTKIISELLTGSSVKLIVRLLQGRVFPAYDSTNLGVASRLVLKAIVVSSGWKSSEVEGLWQEKGDLGDVAEKVMLGKKQNTLFSKELSVEKVYNTLRKLPFQEGAGSVDSKVAHISELLTSASPLEARYIVRTVLEDLRVGVGTGVLRDAIVWAFSDVEVSFGDDIVVEQREKYDEYSGLVQNAYDMLNDMGQVAEIASRDFEALSDVSIKLGQPINVMLAIKAENIEDGFESVGKPCQLEYKYDGFRMQIHKKDEVRIFTRRLEDVTQQFPGIAESVSELVDAESFIIDCEAVGYSENGYEPFQKISQRIKRKYNISEVAKELPVELNVFDIVYFNGKSIMDMPLKKRREIIEKIVKEKKYSVVLAKKRIADDEEEVEKFLNEALSDGQEGLMMKNLESPYKPGRRVGYMVKLKPSMESVDAVIVGAEWGEGKRSGWLTSYKLAVSDDGELKEVGKSSTGLKEKPEEGLSYAEMTEILEPLIIDKGKEVRVKPEVVIEVKYQEIQKSPTYDSGYALRFPSVSKLRTDRGVDDITTLEELEKLYNQSRDSRS